MKNPNSAGNMVTVPAHQPPPGGYDCIIVGAGPAGSAAAIALCRAGRTVQLLDRQNFPRDKICGDGIPPGSLELLYELGLQAPLEKAGFYPVEQLHFSTPAGQLLKTRFRPKKPGMGFFVAPRRDFDYLLQQQAIVAGAHFQQAQVKGLLRQNGQVCGVQAEIDGQATTISARTVIGADGCTSIVARSLAGIKPAPRHRFLAIRGYIEGLEIFSHAAEFHWYPEILPGYGWIFPLGNERANIGLAMRADRLRRERRKLPDLLNDFLQRPAIKARMRNDARLSGVATWPLNLASQQRVQRAYDGALLIGDAAVLIDPFSGEGIHNALRSAKLAASVIDQALSRNDTSLRMLKQYEQLCRRAFNPVFRRSYWLQQCMHHSPFLIEGLVYLLRKNPRFLAACANRFSLDFHFEAAY